jgi:predicted outer membrane repeat protein
MGYHYRDASGFQTVELTVTVLGGHGTAEPTEPDPISYDSGIYTYFRGTPVIITASPEAGYRIESWSGTINDASQALTNVVVMSSDKDVTVQFEKPRVISVPKDYPTIQRAIDAAGEGDQIVIEPGLYRHPGWTHGASLNLGGIVIWNKNLTLTSANPDDPNVVANTVLQGYQITIYDVGPETVLAGFTMYDTHWFTTDGIDGQARGESGFNGSAIRAGAIDIIDASPTLVNIVIDDISINAGSGGDGADGCPGGNGGWGGSAYGGAFYFENSSPTLKGVRVVNCAATGGDGGDGGDADAPGCIGGRGGSWTFKEQDEEWWEQMGLGWDYPMDRYGNYQFIGGQYAGTYDDYWLYTAMGAAAYIDSTSEPTFIDCTFGDNLTVGGYCGVGGQPGDWPDYHHRIETFGTGIYCEVGSAPTFIDCNFTDNVADSDVPEDNHNPYNTYGGGLACGTLTPKANPGSNHSPTLINCTFTDNAATTGGAVFWADTAPSIEDCNFIDNYAYEGGAMFCGDDSTPIIVGSTFTENETGYIYVDDPNLYYDVDFSDPDITLQVGPPVADVLGLGGGMVCSSSEARIFDCQFKTNSATLSGGGIYAVGSEKVLFKNCLITENDANRDGGGISVNWNSDANIINCTISENVVTGEGFAAGYGGGVACSYESYAVITNSIIWGNYAMNGWDVAITTGFEHDPRPSTVKVTYSDIKGGEAGVFVDTGCTLIWVPGTNLSGTSDAVPMFVGDYFVRDRYYLSQPYVVPPDPNQTELSPCVNVGSDDANKLDMYRHTTRTDRIIDGLDPSVSSNDHIVDLGYHYILTTDLIGDFDFDYMVDASDLALFLEHWLEDDCAPPDWCHGADLNRDGVVNWIDEAIFAANYGLSDTTPPMPNPMTWAIAPNSIGATTIYMVATRAYDNASGPFVEYYFDCIFGGGPDRGWNPNRTYRATGLSRGVEYGYRVKARDISANQNETDWSVIGYAVAGEDVTPPLTDPNAPNPYKSTWALSPTCYSGTSMYMIATTATDESGVEYYFECTAGGGNDSGWQSSPVYRDTGLTPFTTYTYRVIARDKWNPPNQNYGFWSDEASAATPEGDPPDPNPAEWAVYPEWRTDPNTGQFTHYMEAEPATDAVTADVWYYFECVLGNGLDSGWQLNDPVYEYPHSSACTYVVRYADDQCLPGVPGNVGQDSEPWFTGPRP